MQTEYREADMIEFHDAGVAAYSERADAGGLGWHDAPTVLGRRLAVVGDEAARLLQALGRTFDADGLYGDDFNVLMHRPAYVNSESRRAAEAPIGNALRVWELRARPEGPHLLHVHITAGTSEEDEYVQELTYSGSYTVWWSVAKE